MNGLIPWEEWRGIIKPYYCKGEGDNKPYEQEKLFAQVAALPEVKKLILKKGSIVDSTVIAAPGSRKNRERKRDIGQTSEKWS